MFHLAHYTIASIDCQSVQNSVPSAPELHSFGYKDARGGVLCGHHTKLPTESHSDQRTNSRCVRRYKVQTPGLFTYMANSRVVSVDSRLLCNTHEQPWMTEIVMNTCTRMPPLLKSAQTRWTRGSNNFAVACFRCWAEDLAVRHQK